MDAILPKMVHSDKHEIQFWCIFSVQIFCGRKMHKSTQHFVKKQRLLTVLRVCIFYHGDRFSDSGCME